MPSIIPIKDIRDTNAISEKCHNTNEPIFITKNGYGDMVIMSMETYEAMLLQNEIDASISRFEVEEANGEELLDAREALVALRRKHLG